MRLLVKVHGQETFIIGYGPGVNGKPMAIVILDGKLDAVELRDIELMRLPKPLRHKNKFKQVVNANAKPRLTEVK